MIATTLSKARKKLETATATVADEIASLRAQIGAKREELRRLQNAPVPREEISGRIKLAVKQAADTWLRNSVSIVHGDRRLGDPNLQPGQIIDLRIFDGGLSWGALCAGAPELAQSILQNIADATEYEEGPPSSERFDLLARLTAELAELEQTEEQLVDECIAAGVHVEHRPDVVERRRQEAVERDIEERRVAAREARQKALNERHVARVSRVGRSRYLES